MVFPYPAGTFENFSGDTGVNRADQFLVELATEN